MKLREWLQQKPFSLTMSSGFFGFYAHCGLIAVLEQEGFVPQSASGSSAGALVTACWAAGVAPGAMRDQLLSLRRKDFWDPFPGLGVLRGKMFDSLLRSFMPETVFEKCVFPVSISVYDAVSRKTKVLNKGDIVKAIRASCAVPLLFHPVWIHKKPYWDGGIKDHAGLMGMSDNERILYHHLLPHHHNKQKKFLDKVPVAKNMISLVMTDLPVVGPYKMDQGKEAYFQAYTNMSKALDLPVEAKMVM